MAHHPDLNRLVQTWEYLHRTDIKSIQSNSNPMVTAMEPSQTSDWNPPSRYPQEQCLLQNARESTSRGIAPNQRQAAPAAAL